MNFKKKKRSNLKGYEMYSRLATKEDPSSNTAEAYRRAKVGLDFAGIDKKIQVIQICSTGKGEGKTTTALNLALTYVEDNYKVCVVDLDFRRPKLHRVFQVENKNGITDVISSTIELKDAIKHSPDFGFDILNRGTKVPYPMAVLNSAEMKKVFEELRQLYDYIIVDCPPVLAVSDSTIISKFCDGCLFVIYQQETEKPESKEAVRILKANGVNIVGAVVTGITSKAVYYYYGSKYKYYHSYYTDDKK